MKAVQLAVVEDTTKAVLWVDQLAAMVVLMSAVLELVSSAMKEVIELVLVQGDYTMTLSMSVAWSLHTTPRCAVVIMFGENGNEKEHYKQDKYRRF